MSLWNLTNELALLRITSSYLKEVIDEGMLSFEFEPIGQSRRNRGVKTLMVIPDSIT